MGDTKHTPGPWNAVELEDGNIVTGNTRHCGNVCELDLGAESAANARLIAAAPELLEALEKCEQALSAYQVECGPVMTSGIDAEEVTKAARAAIKKARGA